MQTVGAGIHRWLNVLLCGGFAVLDTLFVSQQLTNLARSFWVLFMLSKSFWRSVIGAKYVSVMSWYSWQVVKKCSSVSTPC